MTEIVVVATFRAKEGRVDEVIAGFTPVIEQTHQEPGCIAYALHRDINDPEVLVLVERWASQSDLDEHFQRPHMAAVGELAGELLAGPPTITFGQSVPLGDESKGTL